MSRIALPVRLPKIDYRWVIAGLAVYFTVVLNLKVLGHFYEILGAMAEYNGGFAATAPFVLFFASLFLFVPFSFRYLLKPFFVLLLVTGALAHYGMMRYGIVFDRGMIENIVETNPAEANSYLNLPAIGWFVLTGILPVIALIVIPIRYPATVWRGFFQRVSMMVLALVVLGGIGALYSKDYASVGRANKVLSKEIVPVNYISGTISYAKRELRRPKGGFQQVGTDARLVRMGKDAPGQDGKPTLMFLVIGETGRAKNTQANGYDRPTSPFTMQIPDLLAFQNVRSCGTATMVSVPCMFSTMDRAQYDSVIARYSEGLMDVMAHAGISLLWKENDGGCKGVCDRVPNITMDPAKYPQHCDDDVCRDGVMFEDLDAQIGAMSGDRLIALHLIGSHGPTYYQRYPQDERFFMPDCQRSDIENCTQEELVNSFDNTMRYTDKVVAGLVEKLQSYEDRFNVVLLYLSDHGESLGENGIYLHGAPYIFAPEEQTHIPMMLWMSKDYARYQEIDQSCLAQQARDGAFSQDNLFSTVLGAMGVQTKVYDRGHDIFAACRGQDFQIALEGGEKGPVSRSVTSADEPAQGAATPAQ